ncbi:MAG: aminotransferase class V-fold PLP-dependent enzyme, partial [Oscillospiraceae bacterium]|nr:aminotransferase class V-fold PLP-dependent enzyme [Oscillospiraceae bacterium]
EANNLAVIGSAEAGRRRGTHILTAATEHPSVRAAADELARRGFTVTFLKPDDGYGYTHDAVADACRPDTILVSLMLVNNETGAKTDIGRLVPLIRARSPHVLIHTDAVAAAGRMPLAAEKWGVDLLSASGHKLHAPKGAGALYVRKGVRLLPQSFGGGQERGLRAGTEPMPAIAAFGAAADAVPDLAGLERHFNRLYDRLVAGLADIEGCVTDTKGVTDTNGMTDTRGVCMHRPRQAVPYIVAFSVPGIASEVMLRYLAGHQIYISAGSACARGKVSPVLKASGLPEAMLASALRVSFCRDTKPEEIDRLLEKLAEGCGTLIRKQ